MTAENKSEYKVFTWIQPKGYQSQVELRAESDNKLTAILSWKKGTILIESDGLNLALDQTGVLRSIISIKSSVNGPVQATFAYGFGDNGSLKFTDKAAQPINWRRRSADNYYWLNNVNEELIVCTATRVSESRIIGQIKIPKASIKHTEFRFLVLLGWYILLKKIMDEQNSTNLGRFADGTPGNGGPPY